MENVAGDYFDTENYDGSEDELDDDVDSIASDEDYHDPGSDGKLLIENWKITV